MYHAAYLFLAAILAGFALIVVTTISGTPAFVSSIAAFLTVLGAIAIIVFALAILFIAIKVLLNKGWR
ncbi:hypothetical protein SM124_14785 [Bacillus sp. 31A1R]|uniref:Uncharacterized protein n=1 Tax=Robertmurraya mangrovi TaxID=3098077 RepID=A0ABU5J0T9_9BACI|nr:hypothetical protein [Bacillus sp. 31A1R]MDZ5472981.1 hypothetical protein [Bacillus sp. 31A1R]